MRVLGAIGVIELDHPVDVAAATAAALEQGVWLRPFRELIYAMPPYVTGEEDLARIAHGDGGRPPRGRVARRARRAAAPSAPSGATASHGSQLTRRLARAPRSGPSSSGSVRHLDRARGAAIVSRLERSSTRGLLRARREHHSAHLEPRRAGGPQRQQRVVDRAQARPCGDQHGQAERRREVAHAEVARLSGTSSPPTPSTTSVCPSPASRAARDQQPCGSIALARQRGGQVGRDGRAEAQRRDLRGRPFRRRSASSSWSAGQRRARRAAGLVEPCEDRLVGAHRLARGRASPRAGRRSATLLPTPVSVRGDEQAAHAGARRSG